MAPEFNACLLLINFIRDPTITIRTTHNSSPSSNYSHLHNHPSHHYNQLHDSNPQHNNNLHRSTPRSTPYDEHTIPITITCPLEPRCSPPNTQPPTLATLTQASLPPGHTPRSTRPNDSSNTSRSKRPRLDGTADLGTRDLDYTANTNADTNTLQQLPEATLPFYRDFSGTWWNAQALFASDATLQTDKHR